MNFGFNILLELVFISNKGPDFFQVFPSDLPAVLDLGNNQGLGIKLIILVVMLIFRLIHIDDPPDQGLVF